jgi:acetylornithine deacetylase
MDEKQIATLSQSAIGLLQELIRIPSFSREEQGTADLIAGFLAEHPVRVHRIGNNIWATYPHFDPKLPNVLLNSHHDTVKPNSGYTLDPFDPQIRGDKLYGLGSNDAGGSLTALIHVFLFFAKEKKLPFNLVLLASAEEEISGAQGVSAALPELPPISCGIVGEPTSLRMAVAEKGLMVIDACVRGEAGHAARDEGVNAIYLAIQAIQRIRLFEFPEVSEMLGRVRMSVTQIQAGTQHNVVPDECRFVIDIRSTDCYSNAAILEILQKELEIELVPRSLRLNPSGIAHHHPLVKAGRALGLKAIGSPTLSDQALMSFPTIKLGCGDSARSHTADEFIYVRQIEEGIKTYIRLIRQLKKFIHETVE